MAKHGSKQERAILIESQMRKKKIKARDLAKECGVTVQTVNNWRNGGMPNDEVMPKVANVLGLSIEEILEGRRQTLDAKAEGRLEKRINALSLTTGTSLCIIIGAMMMFVALYVTCTINLLFGDELRHSTGYFAWIVVSAVSAFGGAYLAISGLRTTQKAGSQQAK